MFGDIFCVITPQPPPHLILTRTYIFSSVQQQAHFDVKIFFPLNHHTFGTCSAFSVDGDNFPSISCFRNFHTRYSLQIAKSRRMDSSRFSLFYTLFSVRWVGLEWSKRLRWNHQLAYGTVVFLRRGKNSNSFITKKISHVILSAFNHSTLGNCLSWRVSLSQDIPFPSLLYK